MRISTITNWAYGATVVLTGLSAAAFLMAAQASNEARRAVEQHLAYDILAEDLMVGAEKLTDEARLFAMRGDARHQEAYQHEATNVRTRERAIEAVRRRGATQAELAAIAEAEGDFDDLSRLELQAIGAAARGDQATAQQILFGPEHERVQALILAALDHFRTLISERTHSEMVTEQRESDMANLIAKIMLAITGMVFLCVLYFVLRQRVAIPLRRMTGIVMRLAKQDYAVEVPNPRRRDEIGDMTTAIQIFKTNGIERDRLEAERLADQRAKDGVLQMMHRLQACQSLDELAEIVACFAPQTLPDFAGRLFVFDPSRNALALASSWLNPRHAADGFPPNACWGVRRGHLHVSNGEGRDVCCPHINNSEVKSICVPLTAQGDTIGLLYFEEGADATLGLGGTPRMYLELMSENVALALANLRLRERLAELAARDGLTGLLNRRWLDETLEGYAREGAALACIMIDIDHFKRFNDDFGHDAGDAVMQHVAHIILDVVGGAGAAYRFGGEEFTVLLPGATEIFALECAEALRARIAGTPLAHHGLLLDRVTVSLGLAVAPKDGPVATLVRQADAALLSAKAQGRNRTVVASKSAGERSVA
jgi:diguanylate cyclase (GGDEF)-like protein